jgi:transposase
VAVAAIKGQQTANEIASEFEVHVSQVNRWKKQALDAMPDIFGDSQAKAIRAMESERDRLFQQIGKLQVEVDWLKKIPGIIGKRPRKTFTDRSLEFLDQH